MREILFRGRLLDTTNYHYVDWCYGSLVYSPSVDGYYIVEHCDDELVFQVDKETIGQFTGVCDKNGTKIFEGDVIKTRYHKKPQIVEWNNEGSCWYPIFDEDTIEVFPILAEPYNEVIGNIHDNPELLGDEND